MIGGVEVPFDKGSQGPLRWRRAVPRAVRRAAGRGEPGRYRHALPGYGPEMERRREPAVSRARAQSFSAIAGCASFTWTPSSFASGPSSARIFLRCARRMAKALGIPADAINLKAKTNEGVDAVGRGEAIAAHAIATVQSHDALRGRPWPLLQSERSRHPCLCPARDVATPLNARAGRSSSDLLSAPSAPSCELSPKAVTGFVAQALLPVRSPPGDLRRPIAPSEKTAMRHAGNARRGAGLKTELHQVLRQRTPTRSATISLDGILDRT